MLMKNQLLPIDKIIKQKQKQKKNKKQVIGITSNKIFL